MIAAPESETARMAEGTARIGAILRARKVLIAALEAYLTKRRRQRFGRGSGKVVRDIEPLEPALEDLQVAVVESGAVRDEDAGGRRSGRGRARGVRSLTQAAPPPARRLGHPARASRDRPW